MNEHDDHAHEHEPIQMEERELSFYEKRTDAITGILASGGILTIDETRRATEDRGRPGAPYFENRLESLIEVMVERGRIGKDDVPRRAAAMSDSGLSGFERRVIAFSQALVDRGCTSFESIQYVMDHMYADTPGRGARVIARAWSDPGFKRRLLKDARSAVRELGIEINTTADPELVALENTARLHHMIVCTLCSCYPRSLLGDPPEWYKSLAYRTRVVREPRVVLREMGLELKADVEIRVVDSTADLRYIVIPRRPAGTDAMNEEQLAKLVTRNSMVGVAEALAPQGHQ
jgi:nitrile hydratase